VTATSVTSSGVLLDSLQAVSIRDRTLRTPDATDSS